MTPKSSLATTYPIGQSITGGSVGTQIAITTGAGPGSPFTSRIQYTVGPVAVSDVRVTMGQWYVNNANGGEVAVGNAVTYKLALEYSGVTYPIFWPTGVRSLAIDDGGEATSNPIAVELPAGATFFIRVLATFTGNFATHNVVAYLTGTYALGDSCDSTGVLGSSSPVNLPAPFAVTGVPAVSTGRQIVALGDSITQGTGATSANSYVRRALGNNFTLRTLAISGEYGAKFNTSHIRRGRLVTGSDYAIEAYGINDINLGAASLATIQATRLAIWTMLSNRGVKAYATTTTPITTSTDSWATTVNQTKALSAGQETVRTGFNDWLRAGAPIDPGTLAPVAVGTGGALLAGAGAHPLKGYFELADTVESARNSGIWKASNTADGTHPNDTGHAAAAAAITTSVFV